MEIELLRIIIAVIATFRIARLLPDDDGPFYIFQRIRLFTDRKSREEQEKGIALGFWSNINDGIICTYCQGLYAALLCGLLAMYPTFYGDIFLFIFAIAGTQTLLQKWTEK